jgi:hypothetical protein
MYRRTALSVFVAAALAFAAAACDFNPTAPFEGFDGDQGATLKGQFQQSGTGSAQRSFGSSYMGQRMLTTVSDAETVAAVIVYDGDGNEIGSVDVQDGAFTIRGLPESFTLVFVDADGNQLGDPLPFEAVQPNQEIDIVVAMEGGQVVLLEERRTGIDHPGSSGIEIEGTARNIVIDSHPMTGSLDVNDYHILTRAGETSIRRDNQSLSLVDLDEGDQVHVRGVFEGEDVFAYEIKLQKEADDDDTSQESCDFRDPEKPKHILVCHNGNTLSIAPDAWPGHRSHGDTCGPCN